MKKYNLKINGNKYQVDIEGMEGNTARLSVNGTPYVVEVEHTAVAQPVVSSVKPAAAPVARPAAPAAAAGAMKSPLPGVVLDIRVKVGDSVKAGDTLLVLEAMKMENNIEADRDGVIESIKANKGDSVLEGDELLTIR